MSLCVYVYGIMDSFSHRFLSKAMKVMREQIDIIGSYSLYPFEYC